eukprot:scaffold6737_cov155-Skeletonema_dohrnii-CCMP3373.AAC.3
MAVVVVVVGSGSVMYIIARRKRDIRKEIWTISWSGPALSLSRHVSGGGGCRESVISTFLCLFHVGHDRNGNEGGR